MRVIALLTDFGLKDNFVGVMKGVILKINPRVEIVDITHNISAQDVFEAGFLLRYSYRFFPESSIFVAVVDPGVGSWRRPLLIEAENYYFIGPDNGLFGLVLDSARIEKVIVLENEKYFVKPVSSTFHGRDIFSSVAAYLSKGVPLREFGRQVKSFQRLEFPSPQVKKDRINFSLLYIDRFGNIVTNLTSEILKKFTKNREFLLKIGSKAFKLKVCKFYEEAKDSEIFLIEGSFGFLEISLKKGNAQDFLGVKRGMDLVLCRAQSLRR